MLSKSFFLLLLPSLASGFLAAPAARSPMSVTPISSSSSSTRAQPSNNGLMMMSARGGGRKAVSAEPLIIAPDYRVALGFGLTGLGLALPPLSNPGAGVPLALIGAFLATRTQKVRFVFDDEAMEVMTVGSDGELELSGENFAVGGRNRWAYSTFTNWEFYPSPQLPILVYFKETQTSPEGQIHFFPVIGNPKDLYESFKKYVPLPGK